MLYFKDDYHAAETMNLLQKFGYDSIYDSREHTVLCYIIAAIYKGKSLAGCIDEEGVDLDSFLEKMNVFSSSERDILRFGLQLYNRNIDDIRLPDVMNHLDAENSKVVISAIAFLYRVDITSIHEI